MPENENAHPTAATMERAAEKAACDGAAISTTDFNGSMRLRQVAWACVADILPVGAEHAISAKTLAAALGLKDIRAVSRLVERERRNGIPICAATGGEGRGYYLPSSPEELEVYLRRLDRRISHVRRTWSACENALRRMSGQEIMEGMG